MFRFQKAAMASDLRRAALFLLFEMCALARTSSSRAVQKVRANYLNGAQYVTPPKGYHAPLTSLLCEPSNGAVNTKCRHDSLKVVHCDVHIDLECLQGASKYRRNDSKIEETINNCLWNEKNVVSFTHGKLITHSRSKEACRQIRLLPRRLTDRKPTVGRRRVAMVRTVTSTSEIPKYVMSILSLTLYAMEHHYDVILHVADAKNYPAAPHFSKVGALMTVLFGMGYETAVFSDMDSVFHSQNRHVPVESIINPSSCGHSIFIQNCPGSVQFCSCLIILRQSVESFTFLHDWYDIGHRSSCCSNHSFDQIAYWEVLSRFMAPYYPDIVMQRSVPLSQSQWLVYDRELGNIASKWFASTDRCESPIKFIGWPRNKTGKQPILFHGAPWSVCSRCSIIFHTGSINFFSDIFYPKIRQMALLALHDTFNDDDMVVEIPTYDFNAEICNC